MNNQLSKETLIQRIQALENERQEIKEEIGRHGWQVGYSGIEKVAPGSMCHRIQRLRHRSGHGQSKRVWMILNGKLTIKNHAERKADLMVFEALEICRP